MSILLHNHTGHVLSKRGLSTLLKELDRLDDQILLEHLGQPSKWKEGIDVNGVQCINGETITVRIDRHGVATRL